MDQLVIDLQKTIEKVREGGGEKARLKQKERKKLVVRERIDGLVDPGTPFLELSTLAGFDLYEDWVHVNNFLKHVNFVCALESKLCLLLRPFPF